MTVYSGDSMKETAVTLIAEAVVTVQFTAVTVERRDRRDSSDNKQSQQRQERPSVGDENYVFSATYACDLNQTHFLDILLYYTDVKP